MDLGFVPEFFKTHNLSVERRGVPTLAHGIWTAGSSTTLTIGAAVSDATSQQALLLPEGRRTMRSIAILTKQPMQSPQSPAGVAGDIVTFEGALYEVLATQSWYAGAYLAVATIKAA